MSQSSNTGLLPQALRLQIERSSKEYDDFGLISTTTFKILDGNKKIGNVRIFVVPKEVAQSGKYFLIMDSRDRELSLFALKCATDRGLLRDNICSKGVTCHWRPIDSQQLVYLDEIFIEEHMRGRGIGTWAIGQLMERYQKRLNMMVVQVALLTRCEPKLRVHQSTLSDADKAGLDARRDLVGNFFSKIGFRRLGNTEFFGLSKNPNHPSRSLPPSDDPPYEDAVLPNTDSEQALFRYMMLNTGMPFMPRV